MQVSQAPLLVVPAQKLQGKIVQIASGNNHNLLLVDKGRESEVYAFGSNLFGQCA